MFHFVTVDIIPINIWYDIEKLWSRLYSVEMFDIVTKSKLEEMFHFVKADIIPINIW